MPDVTITIRNMLIILLPIDLQKCTIENGSHGNHQNQSVYTEMQEITHQEPPPHADLQGLTDHAYDHLKTDSKF